MVVRPRGKDTKGLCVKLVKVASEDESDEVEMERRLLSSINHPNVVACKGWTTKGG